LWGEQRSAQRRLTETFDAPTTDITVNPTRDSAFNAVERPGRPGLTTRTDDPLPSGRARSLPASCFEGFRAGSKRDISGQVQDFHRRVLADEYLRIIVAAAKSAPEP
jgi:hypothetical protein